MLGVVRGAIWINAAGAEEGNNDELDSLSLDPSSLIKNLLVKTVFSS